MIVTVKCSHCGTAFEATAETQDNVCPSCGVAHRFPRKALNAFIPIDAKLPAPVSNIPKCPLCASRLSTANGLRGSEGTIFLLLLLMFVFPALIYWIYVRSKPYCETCKRRF